MCCCYSALFQRVASNDGQGTELLSAEEHIGSSSENPDYEIAEPAVAGAYDAATIQRIQELLVVHNRCELLPGLKSFELDTLEAKFSFRFPPEIRAFLGVGVPVDPLSAENAAVPIEERGGPLGWHNWHVLLREDVLPIRPGVDEDRADLDDPDSVGTQVCWHAPPDPSDEVDFFDGTPLNEAQIATRNAQRVSDLGTYPLVPIYGHRMMPAVPEGVPGLPVMSICMSNCSLYGATFWHWLEREFGNDVPDGLLRDVPDEWLAGVPRDQIPHWPQFLE